MLNFCDFIQVYVFTINHHLNSCVNFSATNQHRTIERRYGYEIHVSNFAERDKTKSTLCYRDDGSSRPAKASVYITNCTMPSRYIIIYNTRPSHITDASDWPNLEITEVQAYIKKGDFFFL